MLKSMTAYGRSVLSTDIGTVVIEIQSVNRRFLEVGCNLPRDWQRFDIELRKWVAKYVSRGSVQVRISPRSGENFNQKLVPNLSLAKELYQGWQKISQSLDLQLDSSSYLSCLSQKENLFFQENLVEDDDKILKILEEGFLQAIEPFLEMKKKEGQTLFEDLKKRQQKLKTWVQSIEEASKDATALYQKKLEEKIQETLIESNLRDDERLLKEVCIYADRIDITEEIIRIHSHLEQMGCYLESSEDRVGKTLEFLVQELQRETTTIGAKSSSVIVADKVLLIKTELERIKEQVQNVE